MRLAMFFKGYKLLICEDFERFTGSVYRVQCPKAGQRYEPVTKWWGRKHFWGSRWQWCRFTKKWLQLIW